MKSISPFFQQVTILPLRMQIKERLFINYFMLYKKSQGLLKFPGHGCQSRELLNNYREIKHQWHKPFSGLLSVESGWNFEVVRDVNQGRVCQNLFPASLENSLPALSQSCRAPWGDGTTAEAWGNFCVFLGSCSWAPTAMTLHFLTLKEMFGRTKMLIIMVSWAEICHQEAICAYISHEFQFPHPSASAYPKSASLWFTAGLECLSLVTIPGKFSGFFSSELRDLNKTNPFLTGC